MQQRNTRKMAPKGLFRIPQVALTAPRRIALEETKLLEFYRKNKEDFEAVIRVRYCFYFFKSPGIGAIGDYERGFEFFCNSVMRYFTAATTLGPGDTIDDDGLNANFFAETILRFLQKRGVYDWQFVFSKDFNDDEHPIKQMVRDFVRLVSAETLSEAVECNEAEDRKARGRIKQLMDGERKFKDIDVPRRLYFKNKPHS